jgi:chemotaxis protein MotB
MGKKKHAEEHENLERWLVSYADFITLLFATFVALYALAQVDLQKLKKTSPSIEIARDSILKALKPSPGGGEGLLNQGESILNSGADQSSIAIITPLAEAYKAIEETKNFNESKESLEKEIKIDGVDGVEIKINERGLIIIFIDTLLFNSGSAKTKQNSFKTLDKVGLLIKTKFPQNIVKIEGHTDSLPINSEAYPSNWELSSARASSVLRYLLSRYNLNNENLSAIGYADSHPIASNNTPEGRNKNRRVEIAVLRRSQSKFEPKVEYNEQKLQNKEVKNNTEPLNSNQPTTKVQEPQAKTAFPAASNSTGLSKAALDLMKTNGQKSKENVLILNDSYDTQSLNYKNKLKQLEEGK